MKVGDLVKILTVHGHPLGVVVGDKWRSSPSDPIIQVCIMNEHYAGSQYDFRPTQLEVISESR